MEFKRINEHGDVYCFGCNKYSKPDTMRKKYTNGKIVYERLCWDCGTIRRQQLKEARGAQTKPNKKKQMTDDGYHKLFWYIEETPELWEEVNQLLTRLGYDISKDIHEQFLIKHNLKK